jgi:hypothetical protein
MVEMLYNNVDLGLEIWLRVCLGDFPQKQGEERNLQGSQMAAKAEDPCRSLTDVT